MEKEKINIVWMKRDLRTQDHHSLAAAEIMGIPYLILYFFEPSLYTYKDTSLRHLRFIYHSINDLNKTLEKVNKKVIPLHGEAVEILTWLADQFDIQAIFSYQESGHALSWKRDKAVKAFSKENRIEWKEYQRDNVIRGISHRVGWEKEWEHTMNLPMIKNSYHTPTTSIENHPFPLPEKWEATLKEYPEQFQPAGERRAWQYLNSFMEGRGNFYFKHISKPAESRMGCSRISPYLAWGNLSLKQAYHFVYSHPNFKNHKRAFNAFLTRLHWHDHFIQKFEVECEYETDCINRGYESMEHENDPAFLLAWKEGKTGYPLVDACMRCVAETGWINFRMRAMVVSMLCHHFDLDWRMGVYHLAQQFLDYDPGIHYAQFQMQAGTTGINTVRMYNPIKQSKDHDPLGKFIKKWVPELENVPETFIHEPWLMTVIDQTFCGVEIGKDYPYPIVDFVESGKVARDKIWGHRNLKAVDIEKQRILKTHTKPNRKNS